MALDMALLSTALMNGQLAVASMKDGKKYTAIEYGGLALSNLGQFGAEAAGENGTPAASFRPVTAAAGEEVAKCDECCTECEVNPTEESIERCLRQAEDCLQKEKKTMQGTGETSAAGAGFTFGPLAFQLLQTALAALLKKLLANDTLPQPA